MFKTILFESIILLHETGEHIAAALCDILKKKKS